MLIISFISDLMYKNFGEIWLNSGGLKIKFKAPVFLNDEITTKGTIKSKGGKLELTKITCSVNCSYKEEIDVISGIAYC